MTDGTEALNTPSAVQPPVDTPPVVEQVEGASDATKAPEAGWQPPEGFDEHLGKALSKLPEEQREVFLSLEGDGLNNVRDLVLKGVDYTQKRQKESGELRDMEAKMALMEADAAAWAEAKADPGRAAELFRAYAGGGVDAKPAEDLDEMFNEIWDATDRDTAKLKANEWTNGIKASIIEDVKKEQENSPASRQQALSQTISSLRQTEARGLSEAAWQNVLKTVQKTLDRRGVNYLSLSPEQLELTMSPAIDYELSATPAKIEGLNQATLPGNGAASLRGSGPGSAKTILKKPGIDSPIEEKLAWLAKSQGLSSISELIG